MLYNLRTVASDGLLRIGELSKRSGVSPELLRAWERRYGLLRPTRSPGGLRLYSSEDERAVQSMNRHLAEGLAAAEAAALATSDRAGAGPPGQPAASVDALRAELADALDNFDEAGAHAALDRLLAVATIDTLLSAAVLPLLRGLGERWESGEASIAQEHFASELLRGRLLGLGRGWGAGAGPAALLACVPGEEHDLGLIAFGLALRARGWRIVFLGADTPLATVAEAASVVDPALIVLSAVSRERFDRCAGDLRELARRHRVALGGAGAGDVAGLDPAVTLDGDVVDEAEAAARLAGAPR